RMGDHRDPTEEDLMKGIVDVEMEHQSEEELLNSDEEEVEANSADTSQGISSVIIPATGKGDKTPLWLIMPKSQGIVEGASAAAQQLSAMDRKQLEQKIDQLETKLAIAEDARDKYESEAKEANAENNQWQKRWNERDMKEEAAVEKRRAAGAASAAAWIGDDLVQARAWRDRKIQNTPRHSRGVNSRLHPDYACKECGWRTTGSVVKEMEGTKVEMTSFSTLRQLAAVLDMKGEWKTLEALTVRQKMKSMAAKKDVSTASLKTAYKKALCIHAMREVDEVENFGVTFTDEEQNVSEAVSAVLLSV
ncbi:hypothetical protein PENTCL1PPCAC_19582, partial [Pristionchus entomophagus]